MRFAKVVPQTQGFTLRQSPNNELACMNSFTVQSLRLEGTAIIMVHCEVHTDHWEFTTMLLNDFPVRNTCLTLHNVHAFSDK